MLNFSLFLFSFFFSLLPKTIFKYNQRLSVLMLMLINILLIAGEKVLNEAADGGDCGCGRRTG